MWVLSEYLQARGAEQQLLVIACWSCLLYTFDAADEKRGVDPGGRRILDKTQGQIQRHTRDNLYRQGYRSKVEKESNKGK